MDTEKNKEIKAEIVNKFKEVFDIKESEFVIDDSTKEYHTLSVFSSEQHIYYTIKPTNLQINNKLNLREGKIKFETKIFEKYPIVFENFDFSTYIFLGNESISDCKSITFRNCNINFIIATATENTLISQIITFDKCDISRLQANKAIFIKEVYFYNSTFKYDVDFKECVFEKTTSFYGVTFEKTPNFCQTIFKDNLSLVNTNLDFSFEDLETKINSEYESYNKNKADNEKKSLEKFTNDFRDSFRNFKGALIKEHNTLDALNYHKAEFYCKEIELKQKWHKKGIGVKNEADIRKNTLKFKEFVDFCLLYFYRKLCEHHTDFLRIFNNLILLIALYISFFAIGNFKLIIGCNQKNIDVIYIFIQPLIDKNIESLMFSFVLIGIGIIYYCIDDKFAKYVLNAFIFSFFIICVVFVLHICEAQTDKHYLCNSFPFLLFIVFYIWLICLQALRYVLVFVAYIIALIGIGTSVTLINPLIGKLVDDSIKIDNSTLSSITFAYTILMTLVLFSLQKTARKNSIIPS